MSGFETNIDVFGELSARVYRKDGQVEDLGVISGRRAVRPIGIRPRAWYEKLWNFLRREGKIPATMGLSAFIAHELGRHLTGVSVFDSTSFALVTTAGVNYMAADFLAASSNHINAFNSHDCGTGGAHGSTASITGASSATPIVITATAHGFTTNDLVTIAAVGGNTAANASWQITVLTANTFSLVGSAWSSGAYTSGGTAQLLNGAGDTVMTSAAGTARVSGTQTNPASNQYKTVATIAFTGSLTISEWGLFSAASSGTLWDRRWFNTAGAPATNAVASLTASTIGVINGDSIQFSYTLTVNAGGS